MMTRENMMKAIGALAILALAAPALASDVSEDQPIEYSPRRTQIAAFENGTASAHAHAAPAACACSRSAGGGSGERGGAAGPATAARGKEAIGPSHPKTDYGETAEWPAE